MRSDLTTGSKYPPVVWPRLRTWLGPDLACDKRCLAIKVTDSRHSKRASFVLLHCRPPDLQRCDLRPPPPFCNISNTTTCPQSNDYNTCHQHTHTHVPPVYISPYSCNTIDDSGDPTPSPPEFFEIKIFLKCRR